MALFRRKTSPDPGRRCDRSGPEQGRRGSSRFARRATRRDQVADAPHLGGAGTQAFLRRVLTELESCLREMGAPAPVCAAVGCGGPPPRRRRAHPSDRVPPGRRGSRDIAIGVFAAAFALDPKRIDTPVELALTLEKSATTPTPSGPPVQPERRARPPGRCRSPRLRRGHGRRPRHVASGAGFGADRRTVAVPAHQGRGVRRASGCARPRGASRRTAGAPGTSCCPAACCCTSLPKAVRT